ncbi:cytidylate kinase [Breznakia sp. PF5-3]|uniref:cytidylate kinase-like family protein n=1 Tax=unclassified Breznakia TaxID=2623764 RepID=UPI002404E7F1|nr:MULTISPECIES: cytidylate kinase-like family protein [unclassified Breznakia]MDF9825427.1 cytidylate kinase [Breznakia sp. PM6-1]MDF9836305.1 cytidylate kinase [Breznakia sp. PF5-3]MDF9838923.1 cytidylate kinase [Breznakia sp. PFB2-8]MDF9860949.1 cytidylate kinase [Breznakia sp. PH5-24]
MSRKVIVTVSREYGSGGKRIAKELANRLNIPYYDKEILSAMSKESGIDEELHEQMDNQVSQDDYYFNLGVAKFVAPSSVLGELSLLERIYQTQKKVICDLSKNSCVIVGRCSDYILRDDPDVIHVYIRANIEDKKYRAIHSYGENENAIENTLADMDKRRANYYNYFTNQIWGKISNYDLVLNTSKLGTQEAVDVIEKFVEVRK